MSVEELTPSQRAFFKRMQQQGISAVTPYATAVEIRQRGEHARRETNFLRVNNPVAAQARMTE